MGGLPPITGETAAETVEALRGVVAEGSVPAARVPGSARPEGWGPGRATRPAGSAELQLSLDFGAVSASRAGSGNGSEPGASSAAAVLIEDLPQALAAAIEDPSRIELHDEAGVDALAPWLAAQPAIGAGYLLDHPRPRMGTPLALALAGSGGRAVAVEGADAVAPLRRLLEGS